MRMRHAAVLAGLALGLMSGTAKAAYIVNIDQVGTSVVATGTGSVDTSGLSFDGSGRDSGFISSTVAQLFLGFGSDVAYKGLVGPSSIGSGPFTSANSTSGPLVGVYIAPFDDVYLPADYTSKSPLPVSTATFNNTTLSALGLTPGTTFDYLIPTTDAELPDSFTIIVGGGNVSPVPLPASAPMFGAALLVFGAVGYGVKRKKAAAAV